VITGTSGDGLPAMRRLLELHAAGGYRPVVGQVLPFADLARAHQIAESFHKPGNLVVRMV
jgi:NADPH:quinone reductase-like Zn-dependent oxidoreductase